MKLSQNAQKLLNALKVSSMWEDKAINVLFPAPVYSSNPKDQELYWQHDVNFYGHANTRPVNGESKTFTPTANYSEITYNAFKELKDNGLVYSKNNGYNNYSYHLK